MGKFIRFIFGVITGAFVGSALVVLLTPLSGGEFRSQFAQRISNFSSEIEQAALQKRLELEKELSDLRRNISIT